MNENVELASGAGARDVQQARSAGFQSRCRGANIGHS
jgi:hypothetical protein